MAKDSVSLEFITKADCICLGLNCNKLTSYKFIFGLKPFNRTKIFIAVPASCQLDVTQQNRNHVVISEWVSVTNRLSCPQIQIKKVLQDTMEHNWFIGSLFAGVIRQKYLAIGTSCHTKQVLKSSKCFYDRLFDSKIQDLYRLLPLRH